MTGNVPQAGETPGSQNSPPTLADPDVAFFRALAAPGPEVAEHGQPSSPSQRQAPPSPLLESSTFWLTEEQRAERSAAAPATETEPGTAPRHRRRRGPRRSAAGLAAVIALGLIAAFFAWVSAEPFWLAFGHGDQGFATVAQCTGEGVGQHCAGQFRAADGSYAVTRVTLLGVEAGERDPGAVAPARMVGMTSRQAYVEPTGWLLQLRWVLGFALVLLCGLAIAALTGARRLETARARRGALVTSLSGPAVLLLGFLYVAY